MKKIAIAAVALGLGITSLTANAASEQGGYVGGQYNFGTIDFDIDGLGNAKPKALTVLGGWNFNQYFAVEGRLGFGAGSDDLDGVDVKVKNYFSVLARGTAPVNEMFNVYGLLGFTSGKIELSEDGISDSPSDSGFTYGVGAEINFAEHHGVSLEYARLLKGSDSDTGLDYKISAISVGYRYRF